LIGYQNEKLKKTWFFIIILLFEGFLDEGYKRENTYSPSSNLHGFYADEAFSFRIF